MRLQMGCCRKFLRTRTKWLKMAECQCVPQCIFFNDKMSGMPAMADMMKQKFCRGDFESCARYKVFKALGSDGVPPDLFPNQEARVRQML